MREEVSFHAMFTSLAAAISTRVAEGAPEKLNQNSTTYRKYTYRKKIKSQNIAVVSRFKPSTMRPQKEQVDIKPIQLETPLTSFDHSNSAPIIANISNHVTELVPTEHDDFNRNAGTLATLCMLFFALYWNNDKNVCKIVKFFKQVTVQVLVLFYVTLIYVPSPDPALKVNKSKEFAKQVRTKTKLAQTDGPVHRKIKEKFNKYFAMAATQRQKRLELHRRFQRAVWRCQRKERSLVADAEATRQELVSTNIAVQKAQREVLFLESWITILRRKLQLYRTDNKNVLDAFQKLGFELRVAGHQRGSHD